MLFDPGNTRERVVDFLAVALGVIGASPQLFESATDVPELRTYFTRVLVRVILKLREGLPEGMTPVTNYTQDKRDAVWAEVARGIHRAAESCVAPHASATSMQLRPSDISNHPTIALTSILSVDEEELDSVIERFGSNWHEAEIKWPRSSDELLLVVREAIKKFDEANIHSPGYQEFIKEAPAAIADTIRSRALFQKRLAGLVGRMNEFSVTDTKQAVRGFLLLANFSSHWKLGFLSSWEGLMHLNLQAPNAWVPFQGMRSDQFLRRLLGYDDISLVRLYRIGNHNMGRYRGGGLLWLYVYLPTPVANRAFNCDLRPTRYLIQDKEEICRWLIPQIETEEDKLRSFPETYAGDWELTP